jgi:hypothetical protein
LFRPNLPQDLLASFLPEKQLGCGSVRSHFPAGILERKKLMVIPDRGRIVEELQSPLAQAVSKLSVFIGGTLELFVELTASSEEFGLQT